MRKITKLDLVEIAWGAAFLASGGGGPVDQILGIIASLPDDFEVPVATVEEAAADPDKITATVGYGGRPSSVPSVSDLDAAFQAFKEMDILCQLRLHKSLGYALPIEIGALSSVVPCIVAEHFGVPVVDADGAGRAVPRITMTTYAGSGVSGNPTLVTDDHEDSIVMLVDSVAETNDLFSSIVGTPSFGGIAGVSLFPMEGEALRKGAPIHGTLELSRKVGETVLATGNLGDLLELLTSEGLKAHEVFRGDFVNLFSEPDGGLDVGQVYFRQKKTDIEARIYFANESFVLWDQRKKKPLATAPSSICYFNLEGPPYTFTNAVDPKQVQGKEIALVKIRPRRQLVSFPSVRRAFRATLIRLGYAGNPI